jgi:alpha-1,3-rhamnosyl/mannosyltransferase
MRVGFDVSALDPSFKCHAQRGIGRYVSELLPALTQQNGDGIEVETFDHKSLIHSGFAATMVNALPAGRTTARQQILYPVKLNSGEMRRFSFVHFPAHMDAPAWSRKPYVLTVLDLIPLILKDLYRANRPGWRFSFARWLEIRAIRQALFCLAISETTASDLHRLLGVPRDRIMVTPLGVDKRFFESYGKRDVVTSDASLELRIRLGIPTGRPIILYVGGHDERKNIRGLVEIAAEVVREAERNGKDVPVLVLAGRVGSLKEEERLNVALWDFSMASDTVSLGYVSDDDLQALYCESSVFLFPSLYEGFGLPVLEAMAAGVPVACSNVSSMPEVLGDTGLTFTPTDVRGGAKAVLKLLGDSQAARSLAEAAHQRARTFTWERTGELTLQAYRAAGELLGHSIAGGAVSGDHPLLRVGGE